MTIGERWLDGLARQAPRLSEIGAVLMLAWIVAGWIVSDQGGPADVGALSAASTPSALPDLEALARIPLFGKPAEKTAKAAAGKAKADAAPVQASRLNIKLLGTVVAGEHSAAIVQLENGEEHVFFVGDIIQPGVKLEQVRADAIVVARDGKLERIAMVKEADTGARATTMHALPVPRGEPRMPANVTRRSVNRRLLQAQVRDFPKLLSQARVTPHFVDGKADGFVISDIVPGSLYQRIGLQNGDIIRKVNGQAVTSAEQAMALYQSLQNASSIEIELLRAGQVQRVHYDIR